MRSEILIPYGFRDGNLIHISQVANGRACGCICPGCQNPLVARKGEIRTHHFAHESNVTCVSSETLLHLTGKRLLQERFERSLQNGVPVPVEWSCPTCKNQHKGSFKQVRNIAVETPLGDFTPDLSLFDERGHPIAALEVVVTHQPDPEAIKFYDARGIMLLEFHLSDFADLDIITNPDNLLPTLLRFCPRPLCIKCHRVLSKQYLVVSKAPCPNCKKVMTVAFKTFGQGEFVPEQKFNENEVGRATALGAHLQEKFCKIEKSKYLGNTCAQCGSLHPRSKIQDVVLQFAEPGHLQDPTSQIRIDDFCPRCEIIKPKPKKATPAEAPTSETAQTVNRTCVAARMVDFHFPNGKRYREVYYVFAYDRQGKIFKYTVSNLEKRVLAQATPENKARIISAVEADIEAWDKRCQHYFDQTGWRSWDNQENRFFYMDFERFPWKLEWNALTKEWTDPVSPLPTSVRWSSRSSNTQNWLRKLPVKGQVETDPEVRATSFQNREGTCLICGKVTRDWWMYEGATGKCKCRGCY